MSLTPDPDRKDTILFLMDIHGKTSTCRCNTREWADKMRRWYEEMNYLVIGEALVPHTNDRPLRV